MYTPAPFSAEYQAINTKKWEDMTDQEISYLRRLNRPGGTVSSVFVLVLGIFLTVVAFWSYGLSAWPSLFLPVGGVYMVIVNFQDLRAIDHETREEMIEEIKAIRQIRRESLP